MIVPFSHVLLLAGILFVMGMFCAVTRRNLIMVVIGLEIMLNAAAVAFAGAALHWGRIDGQAAVLFILAVAATEVSIGLALVVAAYRREGTLDPGCIDRDICNL
jgi:NADH-quinone oxidoreductase subunit K